MKYSLVVNFEKDKNYEIAINEEKNNFYNKLCDAGLGNKNKKICIVTDSNVAELYLKDLSKYLENYFDFVGEFIIPAGEANKNLGEIEKLYTYLIENKFDRHDFCIALGGGVIGDMTGFASATYLRGIDFVQYPTSLLAQVDSSIGGKTGVDLYAYKNMIGAFHQPRLVFMTTEVLKSLDAEQFACGMAEEIKHALIKDAKLYDYLVLNNDLITSNDADAVAEMLSVGCNIKRTVVENDPTEKGERALLNFGHTIGHAVEKLSGFNLFHGQCVSIGSVAAAYLSMKRGKISEETLKDIENLFQKYNLPIRIDPKFTYTAEEILATTKSDKKMQAGKIKFILLNSIGDAYIDTTVTDEEMLDAIHYIYR